MDILQYGARELTMYFGKASARLLLVELVLFVLQFSTWYLQIIHGLKQYFQYFQNIIPRIMHLWKAAAMRMCVLD